MAVAAVNSRMRTFRDFELGDRERLGPVTVDRTEAVAFAQAYDPLPFHLSEAGAEGHPFFRAMAVSGWHVCMLMNRLMVEEMLQNPVATIGSPGVERIRWRAPVYPQDRLSLETEVVGLRLLRSRPDVGLVHKRLRCWNQARALVMTGEIAQFVAADSGLAERRHAFHYTG